jgi:hypothetical protein
LRLWRRCQRVIGCGRQSGEPDVPVSTLAQY